MTKTSEPLNNNERDHLESIKEQNESIASLRYACDLAKEEYASKKKQLAVAEAKLRQIIANEGFPLFDGVKPEDTKGGGSDWRKFDVNQLQDFGPTEASCVKLSEAKLNTLAELQDRMKSKGTSWAKDIKGVGEKLRVEIEDAFHNLCAHHDRSMDPKAAAKSNAKETAAEANGKDSPNPTNGKKSDSKTPKTKDKKNDFSAPANPPASKQKATKKAAKKAGKKSAKKVAKKGAAKK